MRVINSRYMRWAGPVSRTEEMRNAYKVLIGKPKGDYSEDLGLDGGILFEWDLGR
jgi:hypothetical protein